MSKKILAGVGILFGCAMLFVVGCVLVMFLAPGLEIFGIRYVAPGEGEYELPKSRQVMQSFTGNDIYINSIEVPVKVTYDYIGNVQVEYKMKFIGFTTSERKEEYISFEVKDNNLHINTYELEEFIYSVEDSRGSMSYLNVHLPQGLKNKNVYITSKKSNISLDASGSSEHSSMVIKTDGDVSVKGALKTTNYEIHTKKEYTLGNNIEATNVKIVGANNRIKIEKDNIQNLDVTTGSGSLYMTKARSLNFKSRSGSLKSLNENGVSFLKGSIETYSGNINISSITGTDDVIIKTKAGNVEIDKAINIKIENSRGSTTVVSADNIEVAGGLGVVRINSATENVSVTTRSGYTYLGTEDTSVCNPVVQTLTGKIIVKNAKGSINLNSKSNSVEVSALDASGVVIDSGSYVNAKNIAGEISIMCNGNLDMSLAKLSGNVTVQAKDRCKTLKLSMENVAINSFNYEFMSSKSRNVNVYSGETLKFDPSSMIKSEVVIPGYHTVKVNTSYGEIFIYTK